MLIRNLTQQTIVVERAQRADSPLARIVGLLNRKSLSENEALVISECRSIHMFFMRFAIDVIFTDRRGKVLRLVPKIAPFQMSPYVWRAHYAIEGAVGLIDRSKTKVGDQLRFEEE